MTQRGLGTSQILTAVMLIMALCSAGIMLYTTAITTRGAPQSTIPTSTLVIEAYAVSDDVVTLYVRNLCDREVYITQALIDKPYGEEPIPLTIMAPTPLIIEPRQVKPIQAALPEGLRGIYIITIVESEGAQATQPIEI